ncbi:MAG: hypothetical protein DRP58_01805 [Spirochaetes bacterium]|nr:MAG: hypothetical protein DRP58_01805 [Spirochaetota bacterium]
MNNIERFSKSINRHKVDHLITYDFVDNTEVLVRHGSFNPEKRYSSYELLEINAKAFKSIGPDIHQSSRKTNIRCLHRHGAFFIVHL